MPLKTGPLFAWDLILFISKILICQKTFDSVSNSKNDLGMKFAH